jgi:hypothetical protein
MLKELVSLGWNINYFEELPSTLRLNIIIV